MAIREGAVGFGVLGPVQVTIGREPVNLGGEQQRALVAILLLARGRPLRVETIIERLWCDPPPSAPNMVQVYVSRLRHQFARAGYDGLETTPAGYRLAIPHRSLDVERAEDLVQSARARAEARDHGAAAGLFDAAIGEWRGYPLTDLEGEPFLEPERRRLEELRIAVLSGRIDARFALGRAAEAIGELYDLVAEFPFNEWFWLRLVEALYRCGRSGEALRAYGEVACLLRDELGVSPGVDLQQLHQALLRHEPVTVPLTGSSAGLTTIPARSDRGDGAPAKLLRGTTEKDSAAHPLTSPGRANGREGERAVIQRAFDRVVAERLPRLVCLIGDAGVGKTRLMHEVADQLVTSPSIRVLKTACAAEEWTTALGPLQRVVDTRSAVRTTEPADSTPPTDSVDRQRLQIRRSLEKLASVGPLVLVVDDVQWAAPELHGAICDIAARAQGPILVLCAARLDLLERPATWAVGPNSETIELTTQARPRDARDAIRASISALPVDVRNIGALAASSGPTFERASLAHLALVWPGPTLEPDLDHALDRLAAAGFLEPRNGSHYHFEFCHELARRSLADMVPVEQRARLHAHLADRLVHQASVNDPGSVDRLAFHLSRSMPPGGPDPGTRSSASMVAVDRVAAAGRAALGRGELSGAIELLGCSARVLPRGEPRRLRALADLGSALGDRGEVTRADAVLRDLLTECAETRHDAAGSRAIVELRWLQLDSSLDTLDLRSLHREVRSALSRLEDADDAAGVIRSLLLLSSVDNLRGNRQKQVLMARRALVMCTERGHVRDLAVAAALVSSGLRDGPASTDEILAVDGSLLDLAPGEPMVRASALGTIGMAHAWRGDFVKARQLVSEVRRVAVDLGWPWLAAVASWRAGNVAELAGDAAAAEHAYREAERAYRDLEDRAHLSTLAPVLASLLARQDRVSEARELIETSRSLAAPGDVATQIFWRSAMAVVHLREGNLFEAERLSDDALALLSRTDLLPIRGDALLDRAEILAASGRSDEACRALDQASRIFRRKHSPVLVRRAAERRATLRSQRAVARVDALG
ncbi:MAG: BTAD domain-containing putative transcriptional regulator [Nocardioidaceae bacterium]